MDPIGGGMTDNRNGTGGCSDAAEQLALQLAYLQGGGNTNSHSSVQHLHNNTISANNHINMNQSHSCNNANPSASGLHQTSPPPGGCNNSMCTGGNNGLSNGVGTPNHSNIAPFSDISAMTSGAGDLLSASVGLGNTSSLLNGHRNGLSGNGFGGSLEDLNNMMGPNCSGIARKSQNMTECVPVPTSEHVAEIVGRQGCKIKALRAKTNTYIKTPVRGEEPVFVVTGRKEDVALAKAEILSAADHFSQIRASRKSNINSTLAFGQMVANQPGQTTEQVRVPYRVVGLVVGPKGATIKRIQQQTRTYIVTPSRDKEPVFEVTGLPENVDTARKEIEAHIAFRTQQQLAAEGGLGGGPSGFYGDLDEHSPTFGGNHSGSQSLSTNSCSTGCTNNQNGITGGNNLLQHQMNGTGNSHQNMSINGINSGHSGNNGIIQGALGNSNNGGFGSNSSGPAYNSSNANTFTSGYGNSSNGMVNGNSTSSAKSITLQNLIESNNLQDLMAMNGSCGSSGGGWSNGDSHDSGIGSSPPFDGIRGGISGLGGNNIISNGVVGGFSGGNNGMSQNMKAGNNHHPLLSHQSSLPTSAEGIGSQRGSGNIAGSGLGSSSLLWGELNKALGGLDLSSTTNNTGSNQLNQMHGNTNLNNEVNKQQHYTNVGARSSLDLGSLGRSDQLRDHSASMGASALASQLLQHQQQNMSCGATGMRSLTSRDILSDMDGTSNTIGGNMRSINSTSSVLQQNLEELLQHQNQNSVRMPSSASSTVSSSSPPDSLQHVGGFMKHCSSKGSSNMIESQTTKSCTTEPDQNGLEVSPSMSGGESLEGLAFANTASVSTNLSNAIPISSISVHSPTKEPENKSEEGRGGICAI